MASCFALAVLGSLVQSVALEDYLTLGSQPLPAFAADASGDTFHLEGVPRDGRMIRVALVAVPDATAVPPLLQTFPEAGTPKPRWPIGTTYELKPLDRMLPDEVCRGEVWVFAGSGTPRTWINLPSPSLRVSDRRPGRVTFRVQEDSTPPPDPRPLRLVALVYDARTSPNTRNQADPLWQFERTYRNTPPSRRLLDITLRGYVRPVWGPLIPARPRGAQARERR
jgi:hypothetical protein